MDVPDEVQVAINDADDLISDFVVPPIGDDPLDPDVTEPVKDILDNYNNGLSPDGPPSCDDQEQGEDG